MKQIAFVDSAAGKSGGHNLGFLDALATYAKPNEAECVAITHRALPDDWARRLADRGVGSIKIFETSFYQFVRKTPDRATLMPFVYQLAAEYRRAFSAVLAHWPNGQVALVFHTMDWSHLQALTLAVDSYVGNERLHCHVLLMYWPGVDMAGATVDAKLRFNYRRSLVPLHLSGLVTFYTSNVEYKLAFEVVIGHGRKVALHPFFLGNWHAGFKTPKKADFNKYEILAYAGNSAIIKGILNLPALIETVLSLPGFKGNIKVQNPTITYSNSDPAKLAYSKLVSLAKSNAIELIDRFLDSSEMIALLDRVDIIFLNYDAEMYLYKTSGFLWLAGQSGLACLVPKNTWLDREAKRLGISVFYAQQQSDGAIKLINPADSFTTDVSSENKPNKYCEIILQPFWSWLLKNA